MKVRPLPSRSLARSGPAARLGLVLHAACVVLTLLVCLALPRSGQGILLVPVTGLADRALPAEIGGGELALLGRGPWQGSLLARAAGPVPFAALLRHGLIPIAVPLALCGQDRTDAEPLRTNPPRPQRIPWTN